MKEQMRLEIALMDETELTHAIEDGVRISLTKRELKRRSAEQHTANDSHDEFCCCLECL